MNYQKNSQFFSKKLAQVGIEPGTLRKTLKRAGIWTPFSGLVFGWELKSRSETVQVKRSLSLNRPTSVRPL